MYRTLWGVKLYLVRGALKKGNGQEPQNDEG